MEQIDEKCVNESEKVEVFKKKKSNNAQFLPPMGVVIILCTLMLAGRSIKQNFCIAYSDLLPPKLEITTIKPNEHKVQATELPNKAATKQKQLIDSTPKVTVTEQTALNKNKKNNINSEKTATTAEISNKNLLKVETTDLNEQPVAKKQNLPTSKRVDGASLLNQQRTSEPIIYLFVFVFIYLLLKSIADINSHFKTKMQGDNRLRRYSLQSYAQIHRYEQRRASRVQTMQTQQKQLPNILNMDDLATIRQQFVQQRNNMQIIDNKEVMQTNEQRRSSLPALAVLNYRHRKLGAVGTTLSLRRDSILTSNNNLTTGSPLAADGTETKRRVRMINRH